MPAVTVVGARQILEFAVWALHPNARSFGTQYFKLDLLSAGERCYFKAVDLKGASFER